MRIYGMNVIVNLPAPTRANHSDNYEVKDLLRAKSDYFVKWNKKKGQVLSYRTNNGQYLFLVRFGQEMQTFTHEELLIDADEVVEWEKEQERMNEYRERNSL